MREIVTTLVGGFSNFIGSHFWNFQDEMLGLAADPYGDPHSSKLKSKHGCSLPYSFCGDYIVYVAVHVQGTLTYTPRLLSVDFQVGDTTLVQAITGSFSSSRLLGNINVNLCSWKLLPIGGSLGLMSSQGTLYNKGSNALSAVVTWAGNVSTHASEPQKKNFFLAKFCIRKSRMFLHSMVSMVSMSLYEVTDCGWMLKNLTIMELGGTGNVQGEEICDRLHFFVEECDHIQGFQFIVDDSGGFFPVSPDFLESIADEYTNTPVLLYAVRGHGSHMNPRSRKLTVVRDLHDAASFSKLPSFCKVIVPVGLPFLRRSKSNY